MDHKVRETWITSAPHALDQQYHFQQPLKSCEVTALGSIAGKTDRADIH